MSISLGSIYRRTKQLRNMGATGIGNVYLVALTSEKDYIIVAGPYFKELEGHILPISNALLSIRSRGVQWHERFHTVNLDCSLCKIGDRR